jgi:hypothetical protein
MICSMLRPASAADVQNPDRKLCEPNSFEPVGVTPALATRRRSIRRTSCTDIGFAIVGSWDPELRASFPDLEDRDGACAVYELLRTATFEDTDDIKREVERFYGATRESLSAVWPAVERVAQALHEREELDRNMLDEVLADFELFMPIFTVQNVYGFMQPRAPLAGPPGTAPST